MSAGKPGRHIRDWTTAVVLGVLLAPTLAAAWVLDLADSVYRPDDVVRLRDLVRQPVPDQAGNLVILAAGQPGTHQDVGRRFLLRRLVTEGLADGVCFAGAQHCRVLWRGGSLDAGEVEARLREDLAAWLPPPAAGAPPGWLEIQLPEPNLTGEGPWELALATPRPLVPGRNLVGVRLSRGKRSCRLSATVLCHVYGEVACALQNLRENEPLRADLFSWQWQDLCHADHGLVVGRSRLLGQRASRALQAGQRLRQVDLQEIPLVHQGEPVQLRLLRGHVLVSVRGFARQDGRLGQTITVRNELNGQLVTATVSGPGLVDFRR